MQNSLVAHFRTRREALKFCKRAAKKGAAPALKKALRDRIESEVQLKSEASMTTEFSDLVDIITDLTKLYEILERHKFLPVRPGGIVIDIADNVEFASRLEANMPRHDFLRVTRLAEKLRPHYSDV